MELMVTQIGTPTVLPIRQRVPEGGCAHGRLIDEVRTRGGKRTGKVRCLECQAVIDDPYQGMK
ncbi:MAG: hypothetical protein OEV27_14870 [Nitrospira sp.]|nr:hypothetical protein [Nitrospira sp.]MDH4252460.1 hypothetical protein [Nitrospira sp.]